MRTVLSLLILFIVGIIPLTAAPILEVVPKAIDFGKVPRRSQLFHKIVLKSTGDAPVVINKVNTYCNCIKLPVTGKTIPPGDSLIVELSFYSAKFTSNQEWHSHIYFNSPQKSLYIRIQADVIPEVKRHKPIYVSPHTIAASQYGGTTKREFPINIVNKTGETIPLKLIYFDNEYFDLDFPLYIHAKDTAIGKITLNDKGVESEFEKSIIFEYIDDKSNKKHYSVPIRRKIFIPEKQE